MLQRNPKTADPVKAFRLTHSEEIAKHERNIAAQKSQARNSRVTGGTRTGTSTLTSSQVSALREYNSKVPANERMTPAEFIKLSKGS